MNLEEIFKPGWKRSAPDARLSAVRKITDQRKLAQVAARDPDSAIRQEAIARITEQAAWEYVARKGLYEMERYKAIVSLDQRQYQSLFEQVASDDSSPVLQLEALKKIQSQEIVAVCAQNNPNKTVRLQAIAMLQEGTQQHLLMSIGQGGPDTEVRVAATLKLTSPSALRNLACDANDPEVRRCAVTILKHEEQLAIVAQRASDPNIRLIAIKKLTLQESLARAAMTDPNPKVRVAATQRLTDQYTLGKLVWDSSNPDVRRCALDNLTDQGKLADIAQSAPELDIRLSAIKKLTQQEALTRIATTDPDDTVCRTAFERISAARSLFEVARSAASPEMRRASVRRSLEVGIAAQLDPNCTGLREFVSSALLDSSQEIAVLDMLELLHATLLRCATYRRIAGAFIQDYYFVLGPRGEHILAAHLFTNAIERRYTTHESDLRRLVYLLRPDTPQYSAEALAFDEQLTTRTALSERLKSESELWRRFGDLLATSAGVALPSGSYIKSVDRLLDFLEGRGVRLPIEKLGFPFKWDQIRERWGQFEDGRDALTAINKRIDEVRNRLDLWIEQTLVSLRSADDAEREVRDAIIKRKLPWRHGEAEFFETCIGLLQANARLYEASCFCDNIMQSFDVAMPRATRSLILRCHGDFLKAAYQKAMITLKSDEMQNYAVPGPTRFIIGNSIPGTAVTILIIGPSVEQITLKPPEELPDQAQVEVEPGLYSVMCEPRTQKYDPLCLQMHCVPGMYYPFSLTIGASENGAVGGFSIDEGLFGIIDVDQGHPLELRCDGRQFRIGRFLGAGSGGSVYQGVDIETNEAFAFKFMTEESLGSFSQIDIGRREWLSSQQLTDKSGIVRIYSFSEDLLFLQQGMEKPQKKRAATYRMEYATHGSLRSYAEKLPMQRAFGFDEVIDILHEISLGLEGIHAAGLIHRDIRPENVLVFDAHPRFRICDFTLTGNKADLLSAQLDHQFRGILANDFADQFQARSTPTILSGFQKVLGSSTFFSAPEEHEGHGGFDLRGDIYSAGGILYWLLTGYDPFELLLREHYRELYERYRAASDRKILGLDWAKSKKLFGELQQLDYELRRANLDLKRRTTMDVDFAEVECPGLSERIFPAVRDFLLKTLHPDPAQRFASASEMRSAIEGMQALI